MSWFLLGFVVAWVLEWLAYTFWWKARVTPRVVPTSAVGSDEVERLLKERDQAREQLSVQGAELKALRAQLATALETKQSAPESVAESMEVVVSRVSESVPETATSVSMVGRESGPGLTSISGIGPKTRDVLHSAGISTLDNIEAAGASALKAILERAGQRFALIDPTSWPDQARLIKAGDADGLKLLQDSLKR